MNIHAIIQARTSSTRLPGKVLKPILGEPMLLQQYKRVARSKYIDHICIATSTDETDTSLSDLFTNLDIDVFRGSLEDVLERFYKAAEKFGPADHIIRLTGDCPLSDPALIDKLVEYHLSGGYDYSSNCLEPTLPDGLDAEIMTYDTLKTAWSKATRPVEREHVTPYIYNPDHQFKIGILKEDMDYSDLRWTVDEEEDFDFVRAVFEEMMPENPCFSFSDILDSQAVSGNTSFTGKRFERNISFKKQLKHDGNEN